MASVRYCGACAIKVRCEKAPAVGYRAYGVTVKARRVGPFRTTVLLLREPGEPETPATIDRVVSIALAWCVLDRPEYVPLTGWNRETMRAELRLQK